MDEMKLKNDNLIKNNELKIENNLIIREKSIKLLNNNDFDMKTDLNNGHIYLILNKSNNKIYIGQAVCFTGKNNSRWGSLGRFKSHIREALKNNDDHCVLLNNAIRKYGENNFEVYTLIKCHIDELNKYEIYFINELNSMNPNGYNLKTGGDNGKTTEDTIKKMKIAHLGTRREKYDRKYPEDNDLPKYIRAHRYSGILSGYIINKFPIGIEKTEYLKDISFNITKYKKAEIALQAAIDYLEELKEKYKYINEEIFKDKSEIKPVITFTQKKENNLAEKLPEYIYPILKENKLNGYYVHGMLDFNKNPYPRKEFIGKTNRWNLNDAVKFVQQLKYYNEHKIDVSNFEEIDISGKNNKNLHEKFHLPKYVNIFNIKGEMKGFVINGYPCKLFKCGKYKRAFANKDLSLEENYENCIAHLEEFKKLHPIEESVIVI